MNKRARGTGSLYRPTYTQGGERKVSRVYWVKYSQNDERVRESTGETDRAKAEKFLSKRLGLVAIGRATGPAIDKTTVGEILDAVIVEYETKGRRSIRHAKAKRSRLLEHFASGFKVVNLTSGRAMEYARDRKLDGAENATINRELALLKRALVLGERAGRVAARPHIEMLEENNARQGFLSHAEFERLREALPDDLRDPVSFLYFSGWRVGEMRTLQWRDVDLEGGIVRLRVEYSKSKQSRVLPLRGELAEIIERAHAHRTPECPNVFHRDGSPVGLFRKSWMTACKKAGLGAIIVHDLRRTAVRNLIRAGVPEKVAMGITGHRTRSVFDRYNIVTEDDLATAIERVNDHLANVPSNSAAKVVPLRQRTA